MIPEMIEFEKEMKEEGNSVGAMFNRAYDNALESVYGDNINPSHYTSFAIPPKEYITANNLEWEVGNVIKYVSRYHMKNGKEDLLKAIKYIELLIERKYENGTNK
jgi:hypothetical protein